MNKGTESIAIDWKSLFLVKFSSRFDPGIVFSGMPDTLPSDQIYCMILGKLGDQGVVFYSGTNSDSQ